VSPRKKQGPIRVAEAVMTLVDWTERHHKAARAFAADDTPATRGELDLAALGVVHWKNVLRKAKRRGDL
jgi:hypothetical protein